MHISAHITAAFIAMRFTARPIADGTEYSGRIIGAAMAGQLSPDGARVMRFTIDASGRWLASVDGMGIVERDCDLRLFANDPGAAIRAVVGEAWPAIRAKLERARAESVEQSDICRAVAGLAKGKRGKDAARYADQHIRNALALADIIDGPLSADMATLSDDAIMAALAA